MEALENKKAEAKKLGQDVIQAKFGLPEQAGGPHGVEDGGWLEVVTVEEEVKVVIGGMED
jgi:hypothetical protein